MIVQSQRRGLINGPHGQGSAGNTVDILIQPIILLQSCTFILRCVGRVAHFAAAALAIGENFNLLNHIIFHHYADGDRHLLTNLFKNPSGFVGVLVIADTQPTHWVVNDYSGLGANFWCQPEDFGFALLRSKHLSIKVWARLKNPLGTHR